MKAENKECKFSQPVLLELNPRTSAVGNVINDDCVRLKSIARRGIPRCSLMQLLDLKITSDNLMDPMFCSAQTFYQASHYYDLSKKRVSLYLHAFSQFYNCS